MINRNYFGVLGILIIIGLSLVAAQVTQTNHFRLGLIDEYGVSSKTNTDISGAEVLGVYCEAPGCSSISGYLWSGELKSSSTSSINLVYPTTLQAPYAYGIYVVKNGYIPYEFIHNYAGTGDAGSRNDYLTKVEVCKAVISDYEINYDEGESELVVKMTVDSPINHVGPLEFVPEKIEEHYQVNMDFIVEFDGETQDKSDVIDFSGNKTNEFIFNTPSSGTKDVKITASINDDKCLDSEDDIIIETINFELTCTDNDGDGYYLEDECRGPVDCDDDNYYVNPGMEEDCSTNYDDNCDGNINEGCGIVCSSDSDCGDPNYFGENYCYDGDVYREKVDPVCIMPGTLESSCSSVLTYGLIQECESGCFDGSCIGEPTCTDNDDDGYYLEDECRGPVDCDDNNASINPGMTELCNGWDDNCDGVIDEGCEDNDTEAPHSVTGLNAIDKDVDWILWKWVNPRDADFYQAIIFIGGENVANTSNSFYNATGLEEDSRYTITIHTIDTSGNINDTDVSDQEWTKDSEEDDEDDDEEDEDSDWRSRTVDYLRPVRYSGNDSGIQTGNIFLNAASKSNNDSSGFSIWWTILIAFLIIAIAIILLFIFGLI